MSAGPDVVVDVHDVTVSFGGVRACSDVDVDIRRGELLAFIGPNGAGKTSLVNVITGVYKPLAGATIDYVDGHGQRHELHRMMPHRIARLGVVRTFQNLGLLAELTALENLLLGAPEYRRLHPVSSGLRLPRARRADRAARRRAEAMLERLRLGDVAHAPVESLAYGIRKRIELGRTLLMNPAVLILDEPMAGMHAEEKRELAALIRAVKEEDALTIVLIEHDMAMVMSMADRILAMDSGRRVILDRPEVVQRDPAVVSSYLGTSAADESSQTREAIS